MQDRLSWIRVQRKLWDHQRRHIKKSCLTANVEIDVEARRAMTFKLPDGKTTCVCTLSCVCRHLTDGSALTSSNRPVCRKQRSISPRDASTARMNHLLLRRNSRRARRDMCYGTLPLLTISIQVSDDRSTVGVPPRTRILQTRQLQRSNTLEAV